MERIYKHNSSKVNISSELGGELDETIIKLGNKLYPRNGNGVIFAGGSGSGKGYVKDNLLGIDGKVFDPDQLKTYYMTSVKLKNDLKNNYGLDVANLNMRNPDDVHELHRIILSKNIPAKQVQAVMDSVNQLRNKPNIIFDTTLSSMSKFNNVSKTLQDMGYLKQNIHLVWVLTEYEAALSNNNNRSRVVPEVVFKDIHQGVSRTMKEIFSMSSLNEYMDGDIFLVYNNRSDTTEERGANYDSSKSEKEKFGAVSRPKHVIKADYIKLKEAGKPMKSYNEISKSLIDRINSYVHPDTKW